MLLAIGGKYHGELVDWDPKHRAWLVPISNPSSEAFSDHPIDPIGPTYHAEMYTLVRVRVFGQTLWLWSHEVYRPINEETAFGQRLMETIFNETGKQAMLGSNNIK